MPKAISTPEDLRCIHSDAANRRCLALRARNKYGLCTTHATEERQLREAESVAKELLGHSESLDTTLAVNHALGKLFELTAANRIPVRNAALLAYIGQLLLSSIQRLQGEVEDAEGSDAWKNTLRHAFEVVQK